MFNPVRASVPIAIAALLATAPVAAARLTHEYTSTVLTFRGTELDLFRDGVAASEFAGTATIHDDGSQSIVVDGHFTPGRKDHPRNPVLIGPGGTGRYRDATGSYTFTGTVVAGSNVIAGTSTGSATF